ncbi:hypothetical protein R3P38DRAFT_2804272 [Favolaschia claudopus]|uniref:Uncharacterized protein n=1 Tax=Favolaschia claudopus TaxID=2862362 RepID=A0AAV9ZRM1_9AGAR
MAICRYTSHQRISVNLGQLAYSPKKGTRARVPRKSEYIEKRKSSGVILLPGRTSTPVLAVPNLTRINSGDPAPPPPGPVPVLPNASGEGARPLKKRAHPVHPSQPPAPVPPPPAASAQPHPGAATQPRKSGVRFAPQESSYPASHSLPHNPATISIPTQVMASPIPTPRPSSTPYAPSVAMPTAIPSPSPRSVAPTPMAIDAIRPERGHQQQTARRGGAVSASDSRIDP